MHFMSCALGIGVGICLGTSIVFIALKKKRKKIDYLLFSPPQTWTECSFNSPESCLLISCPFCNYKKFISVIEGAKSRLDICMYLVTVEEISKMLVTIFKKGVFVRILTDKQMAAEGSKSKLNYFLEQNIQVKVININGIMHNKFALIDKKILVTGSFNWTKQGFWNNFENGIIVDDDAIVNKFEDYFQDLWNNS